jgi:hypothetical protein
MELIITIVALAVIVYVGYKILNKEDADGSHPLDAVPIQPVISNTLDLNGDGKVNLEDAKEAVKRTKKKVKEVKDEVVQQVKKPRGRKPKA